MTIEEIDKKRACRRKYANSEHGRKKHKEYLKTKAGKIATKKAADKYTNSEKGIQNRKEYLKSEKGKLIRKKTLQNYYLNHKERRKLYLNISSYMRRCIKEGKEGMKCETIVGYTLQKLKEHLQKQFKSGMNWNNYGIYGWHIDHKRPVSSFDITSKCSEDFKKCWSLDNLQPLWAKENLSKGASW